MSRPIAPFPARSIAFFLIGTGIYALVRGPRSAEDLFGVAAVLFLFDFFSSRRASGGER